MLHQNKRGHVVGYGVLQTFFAYAINIKNGVYLEIWSLQILMTLSVLCCSEDRKSVTIATRFVHCQWFSCWFKATMFSFSWLEVHSTDDYTFLSASINVQNSHLLPRGPWADTGLKCAGKILWCADIYNVYLSPMAGGGCVVILLYRMLGEMKSPMVCLEIVAVTPSGYSYLFITRQSHCMIYAQTHGRFYISLYLKLYHNPLCANTTNTL